jgi:hypothetical protein
MREPPTDAERAAARRILLGTPIASPIGSASSSTTAASFAGGHIPDIYIPLNLVQDARHFAYAVIASPVMCPFDHIRSALELVDGVPPFTFAATSSATALLVFNSADARDQAMTFSPFSGGGVPITLLRPEDSENRAFTSYDILVELRVRCFPLELWHGPGANFFFGHLGKLCCVDQCCFDNADYTVVRAFVMIEATARIPPEVVIRLPGDEVVVVQLRVHQAWNLNQHAREHNANGLPRGGPPPPPPSGGRGNNPGQPNGGPPHTLFRSRGTQTPHAAPNGQRAPTNSPVDSSATMCGESLADGTDNAARFAMAAADAVVLDAEELMDSLRALQAFREVTNTDLPGLSGHDQTPPLTPESNFTQSIIVSPKSPHLNPSVGTPEPAIHANVLRKLKQKEKRANDSAAKLRRSQRLAAKEEGNFLDMLSKAVQVKAKRFDLSAASASLAEALEATGLVDNPGTAASDAPSLRAVASLCGVTENEADAISAATVIPSAP